MAYRPVYSSKFKSDYKRLPARRADLVDQVIRLLVAGFTIPPRHRDHPLKGEWSSYRECHVAPDLLLIYRIEGEEIRLARLGSHAKLFE